jgi:hypothetical protein
MKTLIVITFSFLLSVGYSQENTLKYSNEKSVHFAVFPGVLYNSIALGVGIKKEKVENVLEFNSYYIPVGAERFAIGLHYNRNYYLKNGQTFIPIWTGINRVNLDNNYEDGGPYYDKMNIKFGSGLGTNLKLKNSDKIRFEFGIGAALHLENINSYDNESAFPFKFALNKFTISDRHPVVPTFRVKIRYIFSLKK